MVYRRRYKRRSRGRGRMAPYAPQFRRAQHSQSKYQRAFRLRTKGFWGDRSKLSGPSSTSGWLSLGFPPQVRGILKSYLGIANMDSPTVGFKIIAINMCDMNNDQRAVDGTPADEGVSHVVTAASTITQLPTPYYFDTLKSLFFHYIIQKVDYLITVTNAGTGIATDITVAWKMMRPHDDGANEVMNSTSPEIIMSQDGIRTKKINPSNAARNGKQTMTIKGSYNCVKSIPKRIYYTEGQHQASGDAAGNVGEQEFASTIGFDSTQQSKQPRLAVWAWNTFTNLTTTTDALDVTILLKYHYRAYDRNMPAVS